MDFPIYIIGDRQFIDLVRRNLMLDSVDHIETALDVCFGPCSVHTIDGVIGVGETWALAFHDLVKKAA